MQVFAGSEKSVSAELEIGGESQAPEMCVRRETTVVRDAGGLRFGEGMCKRFARKFWECA